jgi:hypothetical protein
VGIIWVQVDGILSARFSLQPIDNIAYHQKLRDLSGCATATKMSLKSCAKNYANATQKLRKKLRKCHSKQPFKSGGRNYILNTFNGLTVIVSWVNPTNQDSFLSPFKLTF